MAPRNPALNPPTDPKTCGTPADALGAAGLALVLNIGVGLLSGTVATLFAAVGSVATPADRAAALKRGLVAGAALHGAITTAIGLATVKEHPEFGGAVTYIGVTALGTAGVGLLVPADRFEAAQATPPPSVVVNNPGGGLPHLYGGPAIDPFRNMNAPRVAGTPMDQMRGGARG